MSVTGASPDGLPPLRDVIARDDLRAKKALGQNFLLDLNLTRKIARIAGDVAGRRFVEVGPGPGGLTRALLLEGAEHVIAVERDSRCLPALAEIGAHYPGRLDVIDADALTVDWSAVIGEQRPVTIAANLPYGIASILLAGWLETEPWLPWYDRMVLMFQREVAERIVASPGSKAYGRLSVLAQWRADAHIALTLPPEAFTPPPKISSAVVVLTPKAKPLDAGPHGMLATVTGAAFGQRRKMLRASLKQLTPFPELMLREAGIDAQRRAETLSVEEFATLARIFARSRAASGA